MNFMKNSALRGLELEIIAVLNQTPYLTEKEIKYDRAVIKSFVNYCFKNYSTSFIIKNSQSRSKVMALWNKFLTMRVKQRAKFKVVK